MFPQAELALGEDFAIAGLSRSGPSELFGRLSLGTQEQIAVLVRLAMGAMICEKGEDVPVILDDALVFSDDERIEQMFDAINRAGRSQQVIVLHLPARSFASLGGKEVQIVNKRPGAAAGPLYVLAALACRHDAVRGSLAFALHTAAALLALPALLFLLALLPPWPPWC